MSFSFVDIGLGESLPVYGVDGRTQFAVPVPVGTGTSTLDATLTVPAWLDRGWIDIESGGRPISRVPLAGNGPSVPVSIPLDAAPVIDDVVTLDVSSTLIPMGGYCPDVRVDPVRFIDAAVSYTGAPAVPRMISEFLPPVLRQLTVFVPDRPDASVVEAALSLTTSVTQYYGSKHVRIVVRPDTELQGADPDGPFDRSVVLSENNDASAELIYPVDEGAPPRLFVTGSGSELSSQARLITSNIAALALGTEAVAGDTVPPAVLAPNSITLDDLGVGTVTGTPTASIPVDQTRLGRSAEGVSVHLTGNYTSDVGSVVVSVDDATVAVFPTENTGVLDRWIDIPNSALGRVTTLDVTVSSGQGSCGGFVPTVTIDGSSVVESTNSTPAAPLGFGSLPQALMPQVNVALSENNFADAARAVSILGGLQAMSTRALLPRVVSVDEALMGSDPAIVVAADGALPDSVSLPLSSTGATTFSTADSGALTVDASVPYGTVQVTTNEHDAALVVASSNAAPEQLDGLLASLDSDPKGWFGLSGDIVFGATGVGPLSLSSSELAGPASDVSTDSESSRWPAVLVGGVLLLVGIIAAVTIWLRLRRSDRSHGGDRPQTS